MHRPLDNARFAMTSYYLFKAAIENSMSWVRLEAS
jgi:hypothetical protein